VARAFLARCGQDDSPVADLGCGTGVLGRVLARGDVEGFDISPGMLERAGASGAYRSLHCLDLTTSAPSHRFGGVVSSGTFTVGHLGPDGLRTVLGLAKPRALVVLGVNAHHFEAAGFDRALAELASAGSISVPEAEVVASYSGRSAEAASVENSTRIVAFRTRAG
jgi:trans-aconitate methyltransferase